MWHIAQPPRISTPDLARFVAAINEHAAFFAPDSPLHVARATGRLDLMGGIADYSGSLVLQLPLGLATFAAVQPSAVPELVVLSTTARELGDEAEVAVSRDALLPNGVPRSYAQARALLAADPRRAWAAYPPSCSRPCRCRTRSKYGASTRTSAMPSRARIMARCGSARS